MLTGGSIGAAKSAKAVDKALDVGKATDNLSELGTAGKTTAKLGTEAGTGTKLADKTIESSNLSPKTFQTASKVVNNTADTAIKQYAHSGKPVDKLSDTSKLISKVDEVGKIADKASDISKPIEKAGDIAKTVDKVEDVAKPAEKVEDVAKKRPTVNIDRELLKKQHSEHIFSKDHSDRGIYKLGKSQDEIMNKGLDIVEDINNKIGLKEGHTQILSKIDGFDVDIRVFVKNGEVININMFQGVSERIFKNRVVWEVQ